MRGDNKLWMKSGGFIDLTAVYGVSKKTLKEPLPHRSSLTAMLVDLLLGLFDADVTVTVGDVLAFQLVEPRVHPVPTDFDAFAAAALTDHG